MKGSYEVTVGVEKIKIEFEYSSLKELIEIVEELNKVSES